MQDYDEYRESLTTFDDWEIHDEQREYIRNLYWRAPELTPEAKILQAKFYEEHAAAKTLVEKIVVLMDHYKAGEKMREEGTFFEKEKTDV